jgi:N-methylhydantoinase A
VTYRVGIDVGGTFTDLALLDGETGEVRVTKVASTPENPVAGVTAVLERAGVPGNAIEELIHGTTVATNALLERKKALPGLITTKGFRDVVFIQRMNRKHHYDLQWDKPMPYVERRHCLEVIERIDYKGRVVSPLDEESARAAVRALRADGVRDIAVAFLFSYVNPAHELLVRDIVAEEYPEASVSLSHEVYPRWREYDRMSTTLADAFLKSLLGEYLDNLGEGLARLAVPQPFLIMKSNGGIEDYRAASSRPVDVLVSGPVGGVLSTIYLGGLTGRRNLISMDMGGTSFDVSLVAQGRPNQTTEFEIEWGLPVYTPMVDVKTIGAGGGSIAWVDKGGLLRVGPESAGASPGPACYGRGGTEPTVTDANLLLGRINPSYFLGGEFTLDVEAASTALGRVAEKLATSIEDAASAVVELVNFNMVNAIRMVSIDRGLDPREFTLVSFGGAGSLHAGALAEIIGIREVLVPIHQGVFSALGLVTADMRVDESVTANFRSDLLDLQRVTDIIRRLRERALGRIVDEGYQGTPRLEGTIEMRYLGQNYSTDISLVETNTEMVERDLEDLYARFHAEHRRLYGYDIPDEIIEFVNFKVTAVGAMEKPMLASLGPGRAPAPKEHREVYFREVGWASTAVYDRQSLPAGVHLLGPVVIEEALSTTLVHAGQVASVDDYGNLLLDTSSRTATR